MAGVNCGVGCVNRSFSGAPHRDNGGGRLARRELSGVAGTCITYADRRVDNSGDIERKNARTALFLDPAGAGYAALLRLRSLAPAAEGSNHDVALRSAMTLSCRWLARKGVDFRSSMMLTAPYPLAGKSA